MLFAVICRDKQGALDIRLANRPAHVEFLNGLDANGALAFAGPFLGPDNKPIGSLVMIEANDKTEAETVAAADPYVRAGLFASVEVLPWNWVFKKPEGR